MRVAALVGPSGSGKTTLVVELIRRFVTEGRAVGAIKHTHHPLTDVNRGDTAAFVAAGARPVLLAGDREAVMYGDTARRIPYRSPFDLLAYFETDIVLIEGFKDFSGWERVEVRPGTSVDEVVEALRRTESPPGRIR
jgi:molybdopterin-guanine dinucleotide biosynthesis protein B